MRRVFGVLLFFSLSLGAANVSTVLTPGGWAVCSFMPFLCFGNVDTGSEEWIAVILTDAPADIVAFNLDVLCADGVTRSFLIRRNSEDPGRTMTSVKLGKVPITSTTTTLLRSSDSVTSTQ